MTGSEFLASFDPKRAWAAQNGSQKARDAMLAGNVPGWLKTNPWRVVTISEGGHTLEMRVAPNFVAVGTDADYAVVPLTPADLQIVADRFHALIPTRKVAREIWRQATRRAPLSDAKGKPTLIPQAEIETARAVTAATTLDRLHLPAGAANTGLMDGQRKNVIVKPGLDGSHVDIFGGQFLDGSGKVKGYDGKGQGTAQIPAHPEDVVFVQPSSTIHVASYLDDTHGGRLVWRTGKLDGTPIDLFEAAKNNPMVARLVLDFDHLPTNSLFTWRFPSPAVAPPAKGGTAPPTPPKPKPPAPKPGGGTGTGTGGGGGLVGGLPSNDQGTLATLGVLATLALIGTIFIARE